MATRLQLEPRLLRLKDGAAYLSISAWRLRQIITDGDIPIVKGQDRTSAWLVDRCDLDAWIETHKGYAFDPPREDERPTLDQLHAHLRAIEKHLQRLKQEEQGSFASLKQEQGIARLRAVPRR